MKTYAQIKILVLIAAFLITPKSGNNPDVHKQNEMYPHTGILFGNEKE